MRGGRSPRWRRSARCRRPRCRSPSTSPRSPWSRSRTAPRTRPRRAGQTLTLSPNTTDCQGLWYDGRDLTGGTDYTLSGNRLTLTAGTLGRLVGDREYGVRANLEARFSPGCPVADRCDLVRHPLLSDANGSTGSFAIPTQFRGDMPATMEARYDDGSNAGPADWPHTNSGTPPSPPTPATPSN
ncbi:X2-like carbohydrate binding domain-containing protein [Streptomyces sp. NPDC049687]|uniref:X2-like carbohydrate binding domain-containing protein n=1 Tax=Streptomyces sp. NPDC049687 TaxID=3365596 RepID=UPI00379735BF